MTWTQVNSGLNVSLISVAYGNGRFVIFGGERALVSEDGETWTQTFTPRKGTDVPRYVAFADDRFFALSNRAHSAPSQDYIATSTDGVNWTKSDTASAAHVGRVAYGGGSYVSQDMLTGGLGGGSGDWVINEVRILRSTDGVNWVAGGLTGLAAASAGPMYIDGH
jgi:hypothetical protein